MIDNLFKEPLSLVLGVYAEICFKGFKQDFPIGALMIAKEKHWRDLCLPENIDEIDDDTLVGKMRHVTEMLGRLNTAEQGTTYLVVDYFLVNKKKDPWHHSDYGVMCIEVTTNTKYLIPSQWCLKAMEVSKPE